MGAIASGGVRVLNDDVVGALGISADTVNAVAARESRELERREHAYRAGRAPPVVAGRTVILVDDGIATGATMSAAIEALRHLQAGRIVVAVPTAALASVAAMREKVDEVVALMAPADFFGVGQWYANFSQTSDQEVCDLLAAQRSRAAPPGA